MNKPDNDITITIDLEAFLGWCSDLGIDPMGLPGTKVSMRLFPGDPVYRAECKRVTINRGTGIAELVCNNNPQALKIYGELEPFDFEQHAEILSRLPPLAPEDVPGQDATFTVRYTKDWG